MQPTSPPPIVGKSGQVIAMMVRQMGALFLQPLVDAMWEHLREPGAPSNGEPRLSVSTEPAEPHGPDV